MKTNRAPWDYKRPVIVVSQTTKLCKSCGANVYISQDENFRCVSCRSVNNFDLVEEVDAEFYRLSLIHKQEEAARELAASMLPQMAFVSDCVNAVANMSPELVAELNSWIADESELLGTADQTALAYGDADLQQTTDYDAYMAAEKAYAHDPSITNRAARMQAWKQVHPNASPYNFSENG